jgi:hypothetical protein
MKFYVLSLLMFATLAHSKSLRRIKTGQGTTYTLDINYIPDPNPDPKNQKPFIYVFCTDDIFEEYNNFYKNEILTHDVDNSWSDEIKKKLGNLQICLFDLKSKHRKLLPISDLAGPFTHCPVNGIWKIQIKSQPYHYDVQGLFNEPELDFASEIIGFNYYINALLHFKLNGLIDDLKLSQSYKSVYSSFLYFDVIHKYMSNINALYYISEWPLIEPLKNYFEKLRLPVNSAKNIYLGTIIHEHDLEVIQHILQKGLDINVLLILMEEKFTANQIDEIRELELGISRLDEGLIDYVEYAIDVENQVFIDYFTRDDMGLNDLNFIKKALLLDASKRQLIFEYIEKGDRLINEIPMVQEYINKYCINTGLDAMDLLILHGGYINEIINKGNDDLTLKSYGQSKARQDGLVPEQIKCIEILINKIGIEGLAYSAWKINQLSSKESKSNWELIDWIKEKYSAHYDSLIILKPTSISNVEKTIRNNQGVNGDFEDTKLIFNNLPNLSEQQFQVLKKLFAYKKIAKRILKASKTFSVASITNCHNELEYLNKKYINGLHTELIKRTFLKINSERDRADLKELVYRLLANRSEGLLGNIQLEKIIKNLPLITVKDSLIVDRIYHSEDFKIRLNNYFKDIQRSVYLRDFFGEYTESNTHNVEIKRKKTIAGSELHLIFLLGRITPLIDHFVKNAMKERDVIEKKKKKLV